MSSLAVVRCSMGLERDDADRSTSVPMARIGSTSAPRFGLEIVKYCAIYRGTEVAIFLAMESQPVNGADPTLEACRGDLIAYLAERLEIPREVVLARLGDWLLDPVSEERREQYARANLTRRRT